jgi:hypothetical protein
MFVAKSVAFVTRRCAPRAAPMFPADRGLAMRVLMASDRLPALGQTIPRVFREGLVTRMQDAKSDARWRDAIILTVSLWLFVLFIFMPTIIRRHVDESWTSVALDSATILLSMGLAMGLFGLFRATLEWSQGLRAAVLLSAVAVLALIQTTFDLVFTGWVAANLESAWSDLPRDLSRGYSAVSNYLLVFTVNLALFQVSYARRRQLVQDRQLVDARSAAQQAQLTALRYQLNPHFLFNALNSISALIVTRRNEDAERMTDKLSSFLRSSLATDPARLVPLEEELAHIEEYLDIEAVRFGERLNVTIECAPEAGESFVPGFLVQPLVENAIKHGVAPSRDPIHITIRAEVENGDLCIVVENDTPPQTTDLKFGGGAGVGLINVERRLHAVYGSAASLMVERLPESYIATICIPEIQRRH